MRRISALSAALLVVMPAVAENPIAVSKTFRTNDPIFTVVSPTYMMMSRNDRMYVKEDGKKGSLEALGIYSRSTGNGIRDYFLPVSGTSTLVAGEIGSAASTAGTVDIVANYFNVQTANVDASADFADLTFQSNLTFDPRQTMAGIAFKWQQGFTVRNRDLYFKVSVPVIQVTNDLRMSEEVVDEGGGAIPTGAVANMTAAFKQPLLQYGKIDGKQSKWGVADLELILGVDWTKQDHCQLSTFIGMIAPTGNRPTAEYLYEAIVGNNHHWGVILGGSSRHLWKEGDNYTLTFLCDGDWRYLFENTQTRMFDLVGKPWGRYVYLANTDNAAAIVAGDSLFAQPTVENSLVLGANFLTQEVQVKPYGAFMINTALNYRHDNGCELEGGFNFYTRQAEKVRLKNAFANPNNYGIPLLAADVNADDWSQTASFATINNTQDQSSGDTNQAAGTNVTVLITEADLDFNSASHPAVLESTIYGLAGKNWDSWRFPCYAGVGGSYTYSVDNAGTDRWAVFGKLGVSF